MLIFEAGVAERELMRAANQVDVVGDGVIHRHKRRLNGSAYADDRPAGDIDYGLMRDETIDLHANVAAGKIVVIEAPDCHTIGGEAKSIHDRRAKEYNLALLIGGPNNLRYLVH